MRHTLSSHRHLAQIQRLPATGLLLAALLTGFLSCPAWGQETTAAALPASVREVNQNLEASDPATQAAREIKEAEAARTRAEQNLQEAQQQGDFELIQTATANLDAAQVHLEQEEERIHEEAFGNSSNSEAEAHAVQLQNQGASTQNKGRSVFQATPHTTRQGPDELPQDAATRSWNQRNAERLQGPGRYSSGSFSNSIGGSSGTRGRSGRK
ncbi:MAG: hypothetical protein AB7E32_04230 [Desulfovibrio sp.]